MMSKPSRISESKWKFSIVTPQLATARKTAPNSLGLLQAQALLDFRQGKNKAALQSLQLVLKVAPEHMPSILLAGAVQLKLGSPQLAESYLQRFLATCPWRPPLLGVFAGELDYQRYGWFDRHAVRFIMWLNKGPTDLSTKTEFTDWDEVERFAGRVAG